MTTELEKQFFNTFGIECNIHFHQQFNGAQVPIGLKFYKEREKLEKEGIIKIWHKMLNPCPENDCIYWGEYHYPQITDRHYLELMCILGYFEIVNKPNNCEELKKYILDWYLNFDYSEIIELKHQVQAIFKEER